MLKSYPYLTDINFLNRIYDLHNKTLYVNITLLDWKERRIQDIQGRVTSCSMSVNGDSAVRRTANMNVYIKSYDELYNRPDSLFNINKKVFIEVGIKNILGHLGASNYPDYPIIWFPFGTFIIQNVSITRDNSGVSLSMTLGDKMCLLNGTAGGTIPASTNFESYDTIGPDGSIDTLPIRINQIIPELVNHFGGEALENIIVNDIPDRIQQVVRWRGSTPLYLWEDKNDPQDLFYTTSNHSDFPSSSWAKHKIVYNYDCGYLYTDFTYPGELAAGAGDTVCTVLDKIKETLGNFEYYYDVFGTFHFQEIKNYVNITEWRTSWENFSNPDKDARTYYLPYAYNTRLSSSVYTFDNKFIVSYNNSPQFDMVKNDFIIWGVRKTEDNQQLPCRYHLAIDSRPTFTNDYTNPVPICFDTSVSDGVRRVYGVQVYDQKDDPNYPDKSFPTVGEIGKYYYDRSTQKLYTWIIDVNEYKTKLQNMIDAKTNWWLQDAELGDLTNATVNLSEEAGPAYVEVPLATYYATGQFTIPAGLTNGKPNSDWRNVLYFADFFASLQGLETSYYWAEMYSEWPKIYNIEEGDWIPGVLDSPSSLDWWLDLIDNDSVINKFSVNSIGRRSYAKTESGCNCVFEPDIPNSVMVNVATPDDVIDSRNVETRQRMMELGLNPVQVSTAIFDSVVAGGCFNSCYQVVRQLLTDYTDYNENISVTCLPLYHLEPNTRVTFNDPKSGVVGDYIINSISYDVSANGTTMNLNAKKVIEKI